MAVKVKVGQTKNVRLVATGERRPVIVPDSIALGSDTTGEYIRAIDAGQGIVVTPESDIESANLVISHAITTTEVSSNNAGLEFVGDATIDQFGHITGLSTRGLDANNFISASDIISSKNITFGSTPVTLGGTTDEFRNLNLVEIGGFTITDDEISSDANTVQFTTTAPLGVFDFGTKRVVNVDNPIGQKDVVNKRYLEFELDRVETTIKVFDDPILETDATNKRYVDNLAKGLRIRPAALAATTEDLGGFYQEGNTTFDSTITLDPIAILYIDDVTNWEVGDNIVVKDQIEAKENGSYDVVQVGSANTNWIFQRTEWSNQSYEIPGSYEFVTDGTQNGGTAWVITVDDASTFNVGVDSINWSQFQGEGTFTAGRGLTLQGTTFEVNRDQDIERITGSGALILPIGTTLERPGNTTGMLRFNADEGKFEGYDGSAWSGLGGVIDSDADTFISTESVSGADEDELKFFTGGTLAAKFDATTSNFYGNVVIAGNITIGDADTDSISVTADFSSSLIPDIDRAYDLGSVNKNWSKIHVDTIESSDGVPTFGGTGAIVPPSGNTLTRPTGPAGMLRFNTEEGRFEGYDGNIWSGLAGSVIDLDKNTYIIAETSAGANNNELDFYTDGVHRMQIDELGTVRFGSGLNKLTIDYSTGNLVVDSKISSTTNLVLDPIGYIDAANNTITNLSTPVNPGDAVNLGYLDNTFSSGLTVINQANTFVDGIDLLDSPTIEFGSGLEVASIDSANNELEVGLKDTGVQAAMYGVDGFTPRIRINADGRIDFATDIPLELQANAIPNFTETSRDIIALMFTDGNANGAGVFAVNDDDGDVLNLFAENFTVTLNGDVSGSAEVTRLTDTTITTSLTADFISNLNVAANNGILVTHTAGPNSNAAIELDYTELNTRYITTSGGTSTQEIIAPRFTDYNNTNFYVDPADISRLNKVDLGYGSTFSQLRMRDGPGSFSTLYGQGGRVGFLDNTFNFASYSDRSTGDWVVQNGDVQAERFVDVDSTSYYIHPGDTSNLRRLEVDIYGKFGDVVAFGGTVTTSSGTGTSLGLDSDTGLITMNSNRLTDALDPVNTQDVATKAYVDSVAQGLRIIPAALAGTTQDLGATFSAVDNTLTSANTGAFALDGVTTWSVGDKVLVKDQTNSFENGSYEVTVVGDGSTAWELTRGEYFNEDSEIPGAFQFITDGTVNNGTGWVAHVVDGETFTLNTDAVNYYQFSGAGTYTAGNQLSLIGTEFSITNPQFTLTGEAGANTDISLGGTLEIEGTDGVNTTISAGKVSIAVDELDGGTF